LAGVGATTYDKVIDANSVSIRRSLARNKESHRPARKRL
jgi:hypothetical protein